MRNRILTALATLACVGFIVDASQASTKYFRPGSDATNTNWNTANWYDQESMGSPVAAPGAGDRAVILGNKYCVLAQNEAADTIEVRSGARLIIGAFTLTLDNNNDNIVDSAPDNSQVDGDVLMTSSSSVLAFTTSDHTIGFNTSPGKIQGQHNQAQISVATGLDVELLPSEVVEGSLEIRASSATFINSGVLRANRNNSSTDKMLTLYAGTFAGSGDFYIDTVSGPVMQFRSGVTATGLTGDFYIQVGNGTLDLDESCATSGNLIFTAGKIEVAAGESFAAHQ